MGQFPVLRDLQRFQGLEAAVLFSGGKDSLFALGQALAAGVRVQHLVYAVTTVPLPHNRHLENLPLVAEALGLPLTIITLRQRREQASLVEGLRKLAVPLMIAGNLWLEDIHEWYEQACEHVQMRLAEPLWQRDTRQLLRDEITWGLEAIIMGAEEHRMPLGWLGKVLCKDTLEDFLSDSVRFGFDPCGEYGEFHTLALRSPLHRFGLTLTGTSVEVQDLAPHAGLMHTMCGRLVRDSGP